MSLCGTESPLRLESLLKRNSEMRRQLANESNSLCTQMTASRLVMYWLFVQVLELRHIDDLDSPAVQKVLKQAESRYQAASRTYQTAVRSDALLANLK
ncbi:hypothetical protein HG15A2_14380 [Adhaeretor mobilis]|uniref:Uncharacterized protein n=2 Tax=Adhaeretor mobilis TaxID=1930276 RepID=A0A517MTF3_9BACT|nr:hypothetical protein HG15A2_14380 [Adhaeretor mobilis]